MLRAMFSRTLSRRATCWLHSRQIFLSAKTTYPLASAFKKTVWDASKVFKDSPARRNLYLSSTVLGNLITFNLPDVGERIATVEVKEWLVKVGDKVSMGDPICEVQSDKSAATVYSPYDGVVKEIIIQENETAYLEKPLVVFETDSEVPGDEVPREDPQETSPPPDGPSTSDRPPASGKVLATPAVRRMAQENSVNLADVKGTGKEGRVLKEDILRHIEEMKAPQVAGPIASPVSAAPPPPSYTVSTEDKTEPITGFKAVMVRTMTESGRIPQFGYKDEIDVSQLVELRSVLKAKVAEKGVAFSYMPILIKAVSMALHHHPILNSTVNPDCTAITYRADHNVGVVMDTPQGLIVPNVKRVQNKTVFEVATELNRLQTLGLTGQLPPADTANATFSLSNVGAIGGTYSNPMLLPPSVAIGAFGKIQVVPKFDASGTLQKAHVMHVSWSADHRVIDGAEVPRFSNLWKSYVENPASMILKMK